ncbi:MAG: hypothetical protein HY420_04065 [Candidatus Kerfeldbacteria bacterium]|nr:hypothetical protein [Candidatus Kerfeldbacteria bacterium]
MSPHQASPPEQPEVYVGGWSIARYAQVVKWPAIVVIVMDIIVTTARWSLTLSWLFLIALSVWLGIAAKNIYQARIANAAGLGFSAGLIVGLSSSLFQFLWYHNITAFFQIVTTTFLSIIIGVLMSTSAFLVVAKEQRPSEKGKRK